jgi:phenylalanyl-tRNA synthetase beta chain
MKVSFNWLKEVVDIPVDPDELGHALSMVGLQLESKQEQSGDTVLDFEITVNRPDCLSILGLAREIALIFGSPPPAVNGLHKIQTVPFRSKEGRYSSAGRELRILIDESDLCRRYCGQLITGIKVGPSPGWMQAKLEACGMRSINNVVDITNFVMLELGQPMHAFDFDTIRNGTIRIRRAQNEQLMMIDGKERILDSSMLAIADSDRVIGVAGVMGGRETEVTDATTTIFVESAYFQPTSVRRTAKSLELSTDASYRFERGVDYKLQAAACLRAATLLEQYAGGQVHPVIDVCPEKFVPAEVRVRQQRILRILGQSVDPHLADNILTALGFIKKAENLWQVPSFRVDIFREIDLIEEIARHSGYNNIPATLPKGEKKYQEDYGTYELERSITQILRGAGLEEALTYSFASDGTENPVRILNPVSETAAFLRTSLLPALQESVDYNLRHRNEDVKLFELGKVFLPAGEKISLGIAALISYRDLKGILDTLFSGLQYETPAVADGVLSLQNHRIGRISQTTIDSHSLQLCEIFLTDLHAIKREGLRYKPVIPYPVVQRDVSFFIDQNVTYSRLQNALRELNISELQDSRLIDRYEGKNIPAGKVSLTLRLTFQANDRTLTSEEADAMFDTAVTALSENFQIETRK